MELLIRVEAALEKGDHSIAGRVSTLQVFVRCVKKFMLPRIAMSPR